MKRDVTRFLCKSLLFLLPLLTLFGYAEVRLRRVPNNYRNKRAFLERQLDSVEVLVLGSSHAYNGVDPNCLSLRTYNLADDFQSLYYDTRLIRKYLDRMPRLQLVLVEINHFSLWYQLANSWEPWRDYYYYHFWDIRYRHRAWFDPKAASYVALYPWSVTLDYAKRNFNVNPVRDAPPTGFAWGPKDTFTITASLSDSGGRAQLHNALISASHLSENIADLDTMLDELSRRHIRVAFVTLPVFDSYSRYISRAILLRNAQVIDSLCSKYGCLRADYLFDRRFLVGDFSDVDHLNFRGAQKFSRILSQDVLAGSTEPRARNGDTSGSPCRADERPSPLTVR
jgi:hypothetical protein